MRKSILDDRTATANIDRGNMLGILEETPEAYEQAYKSALDSGNLPQSLSAPPPYLALVGMGGSAVAADILKEWFFETETSIEVIRGSRLPGSVRAGSRVLFTSYSGQTAETLEALSEARRRGAEVSCITSGGELLRICRESGIPHIQVTAGLQPRAALPHLLCASLVALERWTVCDDQTIRGELGEVREQLEKLRREIGFERAQTRNPAKQLALRLQGTIPFIYTSHRLASAGRRFKNQLNENSKALAKFEALPEMLHNEVQGWHMLGEGFAESVSFVFLRGREDEGEAKQFRRMKRLIRQRGGKRLHEISVKCTTTPTAVLTTIYYCDYVSFYLAMARGIDPTPVRTIQSLKRLTRPLRS
jgi:glucose/mannose-6-phosphate isomerase